MGLFNYNNSDTSIKLNSISNLNLYANKFNNQTQFQNSNQPLPLVQRPIQLNSGSYTPVMSQIPIKLNDTTTLNSIHNGEFMPKLNQYSPMTTKLKLNQWNGSNSHLTTNSAKATTPSPQLASHTGAGIKINKNNSEYGPKFLEKVKRIAQRVNCNYKDLLALMYVESRISSTAKNSEGTASGLIQIIDSSARDLGTTANALRAMSPIDQLDYVEKYLLRAKEIGKFPKNKQLTAGELYAITFMPARSQQEVLATKGETYYSQNANTLDIDGDEKITKQDLETCIKSHYIDDNSFLA